MNPKDLVRDSKRVLGCLQQLPDSKLVATKRVKIYVPMRFSERGLAEVGTDTYISGIYAITCDDKYYGVSVINAMIRIDPSSTAKIKIQGEDYYEFTFEPGATVMMTINLVRNDIIVYRLYDEIISKGRVPWFLDYYDLGGLFNTASKHAGANIGGPEVMEIIVSIIARDPKDKTKYYRYAITSEEYARTIRPAFIPLKSVIYAASNTTTKLAGSYWSHGAVSALVSPAERPERIETILRT